VSSTINGVGTFNHTQSLCLRWQASRMAVGGC
jgi:hypothetical protein